jgi:hypothetical protein
MLKVTRESIDNITSLYKAYSSVEQKDEYFQGVLSGIRRTLTVLDVYIDGINGHELPIAPKEDEGNAKNH